MKDSDRKMGLNFQGIKRKRERQISNQQEYPLKKQRFMKISLDKDICDVNESKPYSPMRKNLVGVNENPSKSAKTITVHGSSQLDVEYSKKLIRIIKHYPWNIFQREQIC